jgi:aromatic-L-amino-acid decarboxylase
VKDKEALVRTFSIMPEYLKTKVDEKVNNYRDWGIQLGRRFRALKLWFVIRNFGLDEIQNRLRKHIAMVQDQSLLLKKDPDFEIMVHCPLNMICFRFHPENLDDEKALNDINKKILEEVNRSGDTFLTHTKINGKYTIRLVAGQTYLEKEHLDSVWFLIKNTSYKVFENV